MGTVDYYINDGFYSGENADQVTNRNSNSSPKQGFVREIMARPMIRIPSLVLDGFLKNDTMLRPTASRSPIADEFFAVDAQ